MGRIDYITIPKRQEFLYATHDTADRSFWKELAKENRRMFKESGTSGKCIEARELIIALPEPLAALQQKPVRFADSIEKEDMKQAVLSFIDDISKKQ